MKHEIIFVIEDSPEGGFEARALGESIFTEGNSMEELKTNIRESVGCHFDEGKAPPVIRLHYVKEELLAL